MLIVKTILHNTEEYRKAVELRQQVLRTPLKLSFTAEELQAEYNQVHIVALESEQVHGVLALLPLESGIIKMRQVAVDPDWVGKGIGKNMVIYSEQWAADEGYRLMVLHARKTAVEFYLKLGYKKRGDEFLEVGIDHIKMEKVL